MLSVDWDWFVRNPGWIKDAKIKLWPGTEKEIEQSAFWFYDWNHTERHGSGLQEVIWMSRASAFHRGGLDIEKDFNIRDDLGDTTPDEFLEVINRQFGKQLGMRFYSDSHADGYRVASMTKVARHRTNLVHFDAHHDLGYGKDDIAAQRKKQQCDCGSWAYWAFEKKQIHSMDIIYPDWRGKSEWEDGHLEMPWLDKHRSHIKVWTWSEWKKIPESRFTSVCSTHLCRSSAWTPPWLDDRFSSFAEAILGSNRHCLDCADERNNNRPPQAHNACKPRKWDRDVVRQWCETTSNMQAAAAIQATEAAAT